MSKINRRNYKIELDERLFQFVEKAAEEGKMSPLKYIQSLIEKAMYTSETKELEWKEGFHEDERNYYVAKNDKLMFTIDYDSSPWFRDCGCLLELRIHKLLPDDNISTEIRNRADYIPPYELIKIIKFESSGRAIQYAQRYAELYDLEVEH